MSELCCSLKQEVHKRNLGARPCSCFSAGGSLFADNGSVWGDAMCWCHFHPNLSGPGPPAYAQSGVAFGWKKQRFMMLPWSSFSVHHYTELALTDLVCPTLGQRWVCVFQVGLKVKLHSSASSGSFSVFPRNQYMLPVTLICVFWWN